VLDVCCGAGASAIPAAETVGQSGSVIGVDLAENLLELARAKAAGRELSNINFELGDLTELRFGDDEFDAVVCVFGIFFVPDMTAALTELWRRVHQGGKLAITTWGPRFFEPATTTFWNSIQNVRPELHKSFNPWDRICEPDPLRELFNSAGISEVEIGTESSEHQIESPKAWWDAVLGSGYRATVDQLTVNELERVREVNDHYIVESGICSVEANVVYAVATK
jgi:ubiquinone/menaquinone biosynthesis C-methylase UbiE